MRRKHQAKTSDCVQRWLSLKYKTVETRKGMLWLNLLIDNSLIKQVTIYLEIQQAKEAEKYQGKGQFTNVNDHLTFVDSLSIDILKLQLK